MKKTEFILCHGRDVTLVFEQQKKALWSKKPSRLRICIYEICAHVYIYIRNVLLPQPRTLHGPDTVPKDRSITKESSNVLKCMIYTYSAEYMHDFPIRPRMKKLHSVCQRTSRFN